MDRRQLLQSLAGLGIGGPVFHRAVVAMAQDQGEVTPDMIAQAEWVAGLELSEEDRASTARSVNRLTRSVENLRAYDIRHEDSPAVFFQPLNAKSDPDATIERSPSIADSRVPEPKNDEELAFLPVTQLAKLIKSRSITSTELTKLYLRRLEKYNPMLNCVVTLTKETALQQAATADDEIANGNYRGPLHGIPWGAKDLIAYPGYPTTWGAPQFKEQRIEERATIAKRLDDAGAVLVAKLSMGALAMGDQWFNGRTNCPWNPKYGSSGSSAGSASATAAGLVGFSIGTETLGSIVSPSRRCGTTGLRPTFGRISRHGCMPLSWTMDKLGPITRSVEDCALVFAAVAGTDGHDPTVVDQSFAWPINRDLSTFKVGYTESARRDDDEEAPERPELDMLRSLGVELVKIELPSDLPIRDITQVLNVEAATVFDDLTRNNDTDGLNAWGGIFRQAEFMTAVDFLRAMRVRRRLMHEMEEAIADVDLYVNGNDLVITNLTGHPTVVMPMGFRERDGREMPYSVTLTGQLYKESELLAVSSALQNEMDAHLKRPPLDELMKAMQEEPSEDDDED